ncbi:hypothetical protein F5Y16DRAFT_383720 [Xylariaceae sp. FL0255]|nr:hypothetical protein F5Y16DRAFT_383720 [Xylariaceae sp. FL0255]
MDPIDLALSKDVAKSPVKTPKRKRNRQRHIVPENGSLYDILHDHAGVSLFVLPICWTDLHARLLSCRFTQLSPCKNPTPRSPPSSARRARKTPLTVISLGRNIDILLSSDGLHANITKNRAMSDMLSTFYPERFSRPHHSADLDLRFGRSYFPQAVRCQLLWNHGNTMSFDSATTWTASQSASHLLATMSVSTSAETPLLAYISRSHLDFVRHHCFRVINRQGGPPNHPVNRLRLLRSKNLVPKNLDEDSYFIAIMIAMAQYSVYPDIRSGADFAPQDVKVRVMTVSEDDSAFIVYTATVPAGLLCMFHEPEKAAPSDSEIKIDYAYVPAWPVLGLKERLGGALGVDLVGDFSNIPMDTYEENQVPESISPKRRREALSEVFNASFSEDRDSDPPGVTFSKRQCLEEGRIGLVR